MNNEHIIKELKLLSCEQFGLTKIKLTNEWSNERERRENECKSIKFQPKRTKALKAAARTGLSNSTRRRWWFVLSGGYDLYLKVGDIYESARQAASQIPQSDSSNFGLTFNIVDFLPSQVGEVLPQFLHTIWYYNRYIEYSPLIPVISAMLLMFLEPKLAYLSMQSIINQSADSQFYVLINKNQLCAQLKALEKMIVSKVNDVATHAEKLGIVVAELALAVFPSFFIPFICTYSSLTFLDSFLSEGRKVLFRFTLQIFIQEEYKLLQTSSALNFVHVLINGIDKLSNPERMQNFIYNAFKLKMKRRNHIEKIEKGFDSKPSGKLCSISITETHEMTKILLQKKTRRHSDGQEDMNDFIHSLNHEAELDHMKLIHGRIARGTLPTINGGNLLKESTLLLMRNEIPSIFAHYSAELVYQMSVDGVSLSAVFEKCSILCQYIIIIKTVKGVVGALLSDPIKPNKNGSYFGTGITFVFDVTNSNFYRLRHPQNNYFISVSSQQILIGGPNPAIILPENLKVLISSPCDTFGSPQLTEKDEGDSILDIEIYRFTSQYHFIRNKERSSMITSQEGSPKTTYI